MRRLILAASAVVLLSTCSDSSNTQSDPIDNTPPPQAENMAPTERRATPQSGSGYEAPVNNAAGATNQQPTEPPKP
ncbi:hypothetical protein EPK99_12015 [Neorhizobium lilium]|uniref:Lipoprotein n=1 Tax=Neorhizobium lilium TaxID=2503024 RepID=A0A444LJU5_9HYPH|nr:hypothetical protein [Neorhizobium lilium]RWX79273.1 hypothetical protein EPK99_12015 [Neorhizobium lilium]